METTNEPDSPVDQPIEGKVTLLARPDVIVAINQWFIDHFHDSIASRNVEIFNHCQTAKEDLKKRIAAL